MLDIKKMKISFYSLKTTLNSENRLIPVNNNGEIGEIESSLPKPRLVIDKGEIKNNNDPKKNIKVSSTFKIKNRYNIQLKLDNNNVFRMGKINYVKIEEESTTGKEYSLNNRAITYWWIAAQSELMYINNYKLELNYDVFGNDFKTFFNGMINKEVKFTKRHINRWEKNTKPNEIDVEYDLIGFKKTDNSSYVIDTVLSGTSSNDTNNFMRNENNFKTNTKVSEVKHYISPAGASDLRVKTTKVNKTILSKTSAQNLYRKITFTDNTYMEFQVVLSGNWSTFRIEVKFSWLNNVFYSSINNVSDTIERTKITIGQVKNGIWSKQDVRDYVASNYIGAIINEKTLDEWWGRNKDKKYNFLTGQKTDTLQTSPFTEWKEEYEAGAAENAVGGVCKITELEHKQNIEKYLSDKYKIVWKGNGKSIANGNKYAKDLGAFMYYRADGTLTDSGLSFKSWKTYNDMWYFKGETTKVDAGSAFKDAKINQSYVWNTYGSGYDEEQANIYKNNYYQYDIQCSDFSSEQLEIEFKNEPKIFGYDKENYKSAFKWIFFKDYGKTSQEPTSTFPSQELITTQAQFNRVCEYNATKLPKGIKEIKFIKSVADDDTGILKVTLRIVKSKNSIKMNLKRGNEIWRNKEFQELQYVNGSLDKATPLNILPTIDINGLGIDEINNLIETMPYKKNFGNSQRIWYTLMTRFMNNKINGVLSKNDWYLYAVVSSAAFERHNEYNSSDKTHIEEPYIYIPIFRDGTNEFKNIVVDKGTDGKPILDSISGAYIKNGSLDDLEKIFNEFKVNNTINELKQTLTTAISKIIVSPIPLTPQVAQTNKDGVGDIKKMFNTYFNEYIYSYKEGNVTKTKKILGIKHPYFAPSNYLTIKMEEIELDNTLPKTIYNKDFLDKNIETTLLNSNYEKHKLHSLLTATEIPQDSWRIKKFKEYAINGKFTQDGIDYFNKFLGADGFDRYEQNFNLPFAINDAQKMLVQQAEGIQKQKNQIDRNIASGWASFGLNALGSAASLAIGGGTGNNIGGVFAAQNIASGAGRGTQMSIAEAGSREQINASIADAGRRPPNTNEPIITIANLDSPFNGVKDEYGNDWKPFNLIKTVANKEIRLSIAKYFNEYGYQSNNIERWNLENIKTRALWNYIRIDNIENIIGDINLPIDVINAISNELRRGVRMIWTKDEDIDFNNINYENDIVSDGNIIIKD